MSIAHSITQLKKGNKLLEGQQTNSIILSKCKKIIKNKRAFSIDEKEFILLNLEVPLTQK